MAEDSLSRRTAQLDKAEREHLEDVVEALRERAEANAAYQLRQHGLEDEPDDVDALDEDARELVEAIHLEGGEGHTWTEAFDQYVTGVGYTIVNRLAALRCMEVRGFLDEEVTVFMESGLTPAGDTVMMEEFLEEDEATLEAYRNECDRLADEIEILFDRTSAYSLIDPDADTYEDLCRMLDDVPDEVWRADDVLGWVYEYYNRPVVEALDAKNTLEPEDVGPANQFYTPHWVVRMLADNSLGKLYLEATDQTDSIPDPESLSPDERKERLVTPEDASSVPELCTYLIPDDESGDAPEFDHPRELNVIDPACGSGHFLLYAFDILERIWWAETDLDRGEIPAKILEHNLYGVDIDLRSCQLSAFNLYLKARTRAEAEANDEFEMPNVGIVCADASIADVEEAIEVLDEITGEETGVREALDDVIETFQHTEALGSLLDVRGALAEELMEEQTDVMEWGGDGPHTLPELLRTLEAAVDDRTADSFGEQNLRSFLRLLVVLTQEYDVALMNPPYGSRGRMPSDVKAYVKERFDYTPEYYVNFFEACERLVTSTGRIGMLVPWSFMFNKSFEAFREDFVGNRGSFDFFAEFGYDVLDNATVGTVGTVVRAETADATTGTFIRLHDIDKGAKEERFLTASFDPTHGDGVQRRYVRDLSEFSAVPGTPLSYWVPAELRSLYESDSILDKKRAAATQRGLGDIRQGLATGDDKRFLRYFWETTADGWVPFAKGGADAWLLPRIKNRIYWGESGAEVRQYDGGNGTPSEELYFEEGLTYTVAKRSGRRFGYFPEGSIFGHKGSVFVPDRAIWNALSYTNSHLFTYLMLTQTSERMWEVGLVAHVPWSDALEASDELERLAREAVGHLLSKRQYEFVSPHYTEPVLLDVLGISDRLPQYHHPHRELRERLATDEPTEAVSTADSLAEIGTAAARHLERIDENLQSCADSIDEAVFDCFEVTETQREAILQEIALRTIADPREREEFAPDDVTEPSDAFPEMVKDLLLHLSMRAVHESEDGIVPLSDVDGEDDLLAHIEAEFERIFSDHADARLAEVDRLLGTRSASEEAYPNLRAWLEDDLFDYHVSTFDRTPVLWRLTSERLVSDPDGEGFACLVDYHQIDGGLFDRLQHDYLEPRKTLLRERRSAANRRRSDDSLSASEQAEAAEAYARCESGLEQIEAFEDRIADLARPAERDWPADRQALAASMTDRVAAFRERTATRLETLDALAERDDVDMEELFSPSFYETVQGNREGWLDALARLETAFEAYGSGGDAAVEAHLYDLFEYCDDLLGTAHYASNGILFATYYYDQFEDVDQATLDRSGASERKRLLASLASDVDAYTALAREIQDACGELAKALPSEWETRARSEITTEGYEPNRKHGVAINIAPLSEAEIVPELVDDQVL